MPSSKLGSCPRCPIAALMNTCFKGVAIFTPDKPTPLNNFIIRESFEKRRFRPSVAAINDVVSTSLDD